MMIPNLSDCPWSGSAEQVFGCLVTAIWGHNHSTAQPQPVVPQLARNNHNLLNLVHRNVHCAQCALYFTIPALLS